MDDYNIQSLTDSRNAYTQIFVEKLCPVIIQGFDSIYKDSVKICIENDEEEKYLMTFQNFLARVPKWNQSIISTEVDRIKEETNCGYLEDLLTCVHVTQLKLLTNIRVGNNQKKISIKIPELNTFIHNVYIECARKIYKNVYLFENIDMPIQKQKYKRDLESLIKTSILITIRDNMPIESILKAYLDESSEQEVFDKVEEFEEEVQEENVPNNDETKPVATTTNNIESSNLHHIDEYKLDPENNNIETFTVHDTDKNEVKNTDMNVDTDIITNVDTNTYIEKNTNTDTNVNANSNTNINADTNTNTNVDTTKTLESVKFIGDDIEFEADQFTDDDSDYDIRDNNIQIFDHDKDLEGVTDLTPKPENEDLNKLLNIEEL